MTGYTRTGICFWITSGSTRKFTRIRRLITPSMTGSFIGDHTSFFKFIDASHHSRKLGFTRFQPIP